MSRRLPAREPLDADGVPHVGARWALAALLLSLAGCSTQSNYLGFDKLTATDDSASTPEPTGTSTESPPKVDSGPPDVSEPTVTASSAPPISEPDSGPTAEPSLDASMKEAGIPDAAMDSGYAEDTGTGTRPVPNHFVDVLGESPEAVEARIAAVYEQLFHGGENETIYYEVGDDEAYIFDVASGDTRMDALGYGMFVTVQLNHKTEFDRIWTFAKNRMRYPDGARMGLFALRCPTSGEGCSPEIATLGTFFTLTSLLFAQARWGSGEAGVDYAEEANSLLYVLRDIEDRNRNEGAEITNSFHPETNLPQKGPTVALRERVYPSNVWPAFFQVWGEKTGDDYWTTVASSSRAYLQLAAHPDTGLVANTTASDGSSVEGTVEGEDPDTNLSIFEEDSYGLWLSLALDQTWFGTDPWQVEEADRVVRFFNKFGAGNYPATYLPDGTTQDQSSSGALVAMNGTIAGIATLAEREAFIRRVWDTPTPRDYFRYFDGITQLLSLMYLGGAIHPY